MAIKPFERIETINEIDLILCAPFCVADARSFLTRLSAGLRSGELAILDRKSREDALTEAYFSSMADDHNDEEAANRAEAKSRELLQLPKAEV